MNTLAKISTFILTTLLFFGCPISALYADATVGTTPVSSFSTHLIIDCVDKQLRALQSGEMMNAYRLYTTEKFREITSFDNFVKFVENNNGLKIPRGVRLNGILFQEESGILNAILKNPKGDLLSIEYVLVKDGKAWKIHSIGVHPMKKLLPKPAYIAQ